MVDRERLVTGGLALAVALLAFVLWRDYLQQSSEFYGELAAAEAELASIDRQLADETDLAAFDELTLERSAASERVGLASQRVLDMDGWDSTEWKVKNSLRMASPAMGALFFLMFMLSVLNPLKSS